MFLLRGRKSGEREWSHSRETQGWKLLIMELATKTIGVALCCKERGGSEDGTGHFIISFSRFCRKVRFFEVFNTIMQYFRGFNTFPNLVTHFLGLD